MAEKSAKNNKERVLTVGPDIKGIGGISVVLRAYKHTIPDFTFAATNSRHGHIIGALNLALLMLSLPVYRILGFTAVHAHGASGKSFVRKRMVLSWARILGFRTIFHNHGGAFQNYVRESGEEKVKRFLHKCSAVVVLSESWKRYFIETLECPVVHVVDNIVEEPKLLVERQYLAENELVRYAYLGKICEAKGVYDLLDAIALRRGEFEGRIKVFVAGSGEVDKFLSKVMSLSLGNIVEYVGLVSGNDKDALLRSTDVMLLPSYIEGMPIVLLEAGVYRMPSISTPVGGVSELIENGKNGILIEPGDVDALSAAIAAYAADREMIYRHGVAAEKRIVKNLPKSVELKLQELYNSL